MAPRARARLGAVATLALGAAGVIALAPARGRAQMPGDAGAWVIEAGPEEAGAAKAAAADVARAQSLARNKQYVEAVEVLEQVDRAHPAAVHDCNLALAYLRAGALTRAQLLWDVSSLRNGDRPAWCIGDLGKQLATALRASGFVPVTIDVTPLDAVIEVGGVDVRGVHVLWLAPGPYTIVARAPGLPDATRPITVAPPSAHVVLAVGAASPPPRAEAVDAGAPAVAPPTTSGDAGAPGYGGGALDDRLGRTDEGAPSPVPASAPRWPAFAAVGGGVVAIAVGGIFHAKALSAKNDGDAVYVGTPELADAQSRFSTDRDAAIAAYAIGAIAIGFGAWWWIDHPRAPAVNVEAGAHGGAVSLTWSIGGP